MVPEKESSSTAPSRPNFSLDYQSTKRVMLYGPKNNTKTLVDHAINLMMLLLKTIAIKIPQNHVKCA